MWLGHFPEREKGIGAYQIMRGKGVSHSRGSLSKGREGLGNSWEVVLCCQSWLVPTAEWVRKQEASHSSDGAGIPLPDICILTLRQHGIKN